MDGGTKEEVYGRSTYQSQAHKLATLFIMTAGSANASQFPMMFIVYGGAPFLLAYLTFLATIAMPMMHLESSLAQFSGDGNRGIFSTVPLFIGLGYTMSLYAILHIVGDSVAMSDYLMYFLTSLKSAPWTDCPEGWPTHNRTCYPIRQNATLCRSVRHRLMETFRRQQFSQGIPLTSGDLVVLVPPKSYRDAAAGCVPGLYGPLQSFYMRRQNDWMESSFSQIQAQPLISLAAVWMLVFALAHRGFNKIKRFFYLMAVLYLVTTAMLLMRGFMLTGAMEGLGMFLYTDWSSMINLEMWSNALYVSLESVGVTGTIYLGIVRFNHFKNKYQEDVMFVLVADTATKSLGTAMTFMFLGHLSSNIGIDIGMLVDMDSNFIVSITPQAMTTVQHPKFWSQIHSLWLISAMLPKFLIVPDIIIEVLSASHPPLLVNRTMVHFFICLFLLMTSIVVCSPGGASIAAIIFHNHDQYVRFVILMLESLVILQFYGLRRLIIDCKIMTGEAPSPLIKVCWTSVVPVTVIFLLSVQLWFPSTDPKHVHYPLWINAVVLWFDLVELSFIPVYALVFYSYTKLGLRNCLIPLPTWTPSNWEQTMLHRQVAMAEGFNRTQEEQRYAELPPNISVLQEEHTELSTTGATATEVLGTHLVVAGEGTFVTPGTSSWRYDSLDELDTKKKDALASANAMPESGTLHVSRKISSILNIVRKPIDTSQKGKLSSRRSVTVAPSLEKKPKSKSKKIPVGKPGKGSSTSTTGTVAGQTAVDSEGRLLVLVPPLDLMALPDAAPGPEAPPAPPAVAALPAKRTKRKKDKAAEKSLRRSASGKVTSTVKSPDPKVESAFFRTLLHKLLSQIPKRKSGQMDPASVLVGKTNSMTATYQSHVKADSAVPRPNAKFQKQEALGTGAEDRLPRGLQGVDVVEPKDKKKRTKKHIKHSKRPADELVHDRPQDQSPELQPQAQQPPQSQPRSQSKIKERVTRKAEKAPKEETPDHPSRL